MTTVTNHPVICDCGHVGAIKMKENDQPYSNQWEKYSLVDLNSNLANIEGVFLEWEKVFSHLKPTCPKCGKQLTQKNLH